jgi:hypothetical protein
MRASNAKAFLILNSKDFKKNSMRPKSYSESFLFLPL